MIANIILSSFPKTISQIITLTIISSVPLHRHLHHHIHLLARVSSSACCCFLGHEHIVSCPGLWCTLQVIYESYIPRNFKLTHGGSNWADMCHTLLSSCCRYTLLSSSSSTVVTRCYCYFYYCSNTLSFMLLLPRHLVELSLCSLFLTSPYPYILSLCCCQHYYFVPSCCHSTVAAIVTTLSLRAVTNTVAAVVISNEQIVAIMIHFNSMQTVMSII